MSPDVLGVLIPIIAVTGAFVSLIVKTMTRHQREMAEILHRNGVASDPRVDALQREVSELKALVHQQAIALDSIAFPLPQNDVRQTVGG